MSLKPIIEKIFKKYTDYLEPGQAVTQMASLGSLSSDLYQDSKRFIYELLQNADDSSIAGKKVRVSVNLIGNDLIVAHDGKPFDDRDVQGISDVGHGTKKKASDKTGYKGIGFKAVFGQSDKVMIFSGGEYFRFEKNYKHPWKKNWEGTQEEWEIENERPFSFPWPIIPIYTETNEVSPEVNNFLARNGWTVATIIRLRKREEVATAFNLLTQKVDMYLFLKNISEINFQNTATKTFIEIVEDSYRQTVIKVNGLEQSRWLKKTIELTIPQSIKEKLANDNDLPEKIRDATKAEIVLAAKIKEDDFIFLSVADRRLYAYLPTEEKGYDIPVLVNAAFYMVANREALHKQAVWNRWLFTNIPAELMKWIAELVKGPMKSQVYQLLPKMLTNGDGLSEGYNSALETAKGSIPFILSVVGDLLKVNEVLIDFTFLSEKSFVGASVITNFKKNVDKIASLASNPFAINLDNRRLKNFGANSFDWAEVPELLKDVSYETIVDVEKDKNLIKYLKDLSTNDRVADVNNKVLKEWPFLLDANSKLKCPKDVFFPVTGEEPSHDSSVSYIHPELEVWVNKEADIKIWLEELGVVEKSDITYLEKTIIPNVETFITPENSIKTIKDIFNLFEKGAIGKDKLDQLGKLKLLTTTGALVPAQNTYLSDQYHPRLALQTILDQDIYLSYDYIGDIQRRSQWKAFLLLLGVSEGIEIVLYEKRLLNETLLSCGIKNEYLTRPEHKFTFYNSYWVEEIKGIITFLFLRYTELNHAFSIIFWTDVIKNVALPEITKPITVYYGRSTKPSWITGDELPNYLQWYVANVSSLPNTIKIPLNAASIFLNTPENIKMAGRYLPVFDGPDLNADWRAFFGFKSRLVLEDYLQLLTKLSEDPGGDNKTRTQAIYEDLLEGYPGWDEAKQEVIIQWAATGKLADINGTYKDVKDLNFYADGDNAIFGNSYSFIQLGFSAKRHTNILPLLALFQITVLRQDQFNIKTSEDLPRSLLQDKLQKILPFWAKWMEKDRQSGYEEMLSDLEFKMDTLEIWEASELYITYGESWNKKVLLHYQENENQLYVTKPWDSNKVMLVLPDKLCEIFPVKKYANEISFLLRSTIPEIEEHFREEGIGLPPVYDESTNNGTPFSGDGSASAPDHETNNKQSIDYEKYWSASQKHNKELLQKCHNDPALVLKTGLTEQQGGKTVSVYHFSHIENAISIIREGAIKSRQEAVFQDSAGSGIIAQTDVERKAYARFYFRNKTPTQYYVENLGRGNDSIKHIGSDPLCPVPVFFVIPLEDSLQQSEWGVSIGSLASPQVEFGNDIETISKFDFDGVYKSLLDIGSVRFRIAAHQEFIVKDQLEISSINYRLVVQDEYAKACLLAMLGDIASEFISRVHVNTDFFNLENAKVQITTGSGYLTASLSKKHDGYFVIQHSAGSSWQEVIGEISRQYNNSDWITTFSTKTVTIKGVLTNIDYKVFYVYKGRIWLIHTNTTKFNFNITYIKVGLEEWLASPNSDIPALFNALKAHPELDYYYNLPVGGPDGLSLEEHTAEVLNNYLKYFKGKQRIFSHENQYLLCLALHDIGKPNAITKGNKSLQHQETLQIINRIAPVLPVTVDEIERIKNFVNGDPIGGFLNPNVSNDIKVTTEKLDQMAKDLKISVDALWPDLVIYYQCDAGGYQSLRDKVFVIDDVTNELRINGPADRLLFRGDYEKKFIDLEKYIKLLY